MKFELRKTARYASFHLKEVSKICHPSSRRDGFLLKSFFIPTFLLRSKERNYEKLSRACKRREKPQTQEHEKVDFFVLSKMFILKHHYVTNSSPK